MNKAVSVRLSDDLYEAVQKSDKNPSDCIRDALTYYFENGAPELLPPKQLTEWDVENVIYRFMQKEFPGKWPKRLLTEEDVKLIANNVMDSREGTLDFLFDKAKEQLRYELQYPKLFPQSGSR